MRWSREVTSHSDSQYGDVSFLPLSAPVAVAVTEQKLGTSMWWVLKNGHRFVDTLPIKRWSPCPYLLNLDSLVIILAKSVMEVTACEPQG